MGKNEPAIGGKPKTQKIPNEFKREAAVARKKGSNITPTVTQIENEFGDGSSLTKDYRPSPTIVGSVVSQKREICYGVALSRLLQAVYNLNVKDIKSFLEFSYDDLPKKLKPTEFASKLANLELKNIKQALDHIKTKGVRTVSSTSGKAGGSGHHEKWDFSIQENATAEFIREKLDHSPVAISFHVDVGENNFLEIGKGIYEVEILKAKTAKKLSSHMVLVVGYGYTTDGKLFFLIQNSWGTRWGVNGYGRISINDNSGATVIYDP